MASGLASGLSILIIPLAFAPGAPVQTSGTSDRDRLSKAALAVWKDDVRTLEAAANRGLPLDARLEGGYTLLHHAVQKKAHRCVAFLVNHGQDLDARTSRTAFTPLHFAAMVGNTVDAKRLLGKGATNGLRSNDGLTAYDVARAKGFTELARLLAPSSEGPRDRR